MPAHEANAQADMGAARLKVFLSYSRKDAAFAKELLTALELLGFNAYLDTEDIAPGEPWEERLGNLIRQADTVVFVISPHSLISKHCTWEVEETARAAKRLVPVILSAVTNDDVPELLRRLNYVYFSEGQSFAKGLGELAKALRVDAGWIREHTRYGELAIRWRERGKPEALLLRGSDLDDAGRWIAERPTEAPEISAGQQAYIAASVAAADAERAAKQRLRWRVQAGLAASSVVLAVLAGFSFLQWRTAEAAKLELAASNARLERRLALRAAPRGYIPYDVPAGWFQVATRYASAVAFTEKRTQPDQFTASGVLIDARQLNPAWEAKPVFVTATYVIGTDRQTYPSSIAPMEAQLVMLGPQNERRTARLGTVLWQSESLGVSVSTIDEPLPPDVTPIRTLATAPAALNGLSTLSASDLGALFDDKAMLRDTSDRRPIVFMGNLEGRMEVALSISHLLGRLGQAAGGTADPRALSQAIPNLLPIDCGRLGSVPCPPPVGQSRAISPMPMPSVVEPDLFYIHSTLPGGGGSPIFDAETGELIGIHLQGYPCAVPVPAGRRCAAAGTSLPRILAAIRG